MYHLIGIKGAGMSALAQVLYDLGYEVQGSDKETHFFTEDALKEKGIKMLPFDENNIKEGMTIIQGNTFKNDNPEVQKALELNLTIYTYQEMLAKLTEKFKSICISGCHGKTTTTSMMAHVLDNLKGCNYLIGDATGKAKKENEYFTLESCEYQRHFLSYDPDYVIITNIDLDHTDYYKDIDDVIDAYKSFAQKADKMVIACGDDPYTHTLEIDPPIFFYGLKEDNDIIAKDVEYTENGISFDVLVEENYYGHFDIPFYGKHMLLNALAVISVCYYERMDAKEVAKQLKTFKGARRRFTETKVGNNILVDDYAHHPVEIKATIKSAMQKYPDKEIVAVFQPHTFTRVQEFGSEFAEVLNLAHKSYVLDIHPAREKQEDFPDITSDNILKELKNGEHINMDEYSKLSDYENTVILFMSPNDLSPLENGCLEEMKNKNLDE